MWIKNPILSVCALLGLFGCVALDEPGGLLEPHPDGLLTQATLDSGPVKVSEARRSALADGAESQEGVPTEVTEPVVPEASESEEAPGVPETSAAPEEAAVTEEPGKSSEESAEAVRGDTPVDGSDSTDPSHESMPSNDGSAQEESARGEVLADEGKEAVDLAEPVAPEAESRDAQLQMEGVVSEGEAAAVALATESSPEAEAPAVEEADEVSAAGEEPEFPVESLVPPSPASDAEALAVLDRLPQKVAPDGAPLLPVPVESERCLPGTDARTTPLSQLRMSRWGSEGGKPFAILVAPKGDEFRVEVGDRVGPHGGLVVEIDTSKVTIYELRLDDEEKATQVREVIRLRN